MDINIYVTSDLTTSERKISPQWKLGYFKTKLEQITGISPKFQSLQLYSASSNDYTIISGDDDTTLSNLNLSPYCRIHVVDSDPQSELKDLVDNQDLPYFKLSEEEYAKRSNTVLSWKASQKLGRFDPQYQERKEAKLKAEREAASHMKVGDRCRIISIGGERRGSIRFIGKIEALDEGEGIWVGIEFDEPVGKNNGLIGKTVIFSCRDKHGSFVKPDKVEVGDFPEEDLFDEEL